MYAIIVTGGKQYRVEQGDIVYIEKLDVEADSEVKFDQVLAVGEEGSVKVGAPVVEGQGQEAEHHHLSSQEAQCSPHGPSSALHQG